MGEINFLDDKNAKPDGLSVRQRERDDRYKLKWTSPEKIAGSSSPEESGLISSGLQTAEKPASAKNGYKKTEKATAGSVNDKNFFRRLFNFKKTIGPSPNSGNELYDRKKAIAEYSEIQYQEKNARKNNIAQDNSGGIATQSHSANNIKNPPALDAGRSRTSRWSAPNIIKTDLIKDEASIFIDWGKNLKNLFANMILAAFIIAIVYYGLISWGKGAAEQVKAINKEIADLSDKILTANEEIKETKEFQRKLSAIKKILDNHIYWTKFFEFLEKDTLPGVYYTGGFKGDLTGKLTLSAVGENYEGMTNQIRVFKADKENVVDAITYKGEIASEKSEDSSKTTKGTGQNNVKFQINLIVKPEIFKK